MSDLPITPRGWSAGMVERHEGVVASLHPWLQRWLWVVEKLWAPGARPYAFEGLRDAARQNTLEKAGRSRAKWGQSWHNVNPSLAVDIVPVMAETPTTIVWKGLREKQLLSELATLFPWLTWGDTFFKGDIYHFQMPSTAGPHRHPEVNWDADWVADLQIKVGR